MNTCRTRLFPPLFSRGLPLLLTVFFVPLFFSCTQALPEILAVSTRLVRMEDTPGVRGAEAGSSVDGERPVEYLSFFCMVRDDDGIVDLEEFWLVNDAEELYWHLDSREWLWIEHSGENWVGSHELRMPNGAAFPAGAWRVLLADKAGERTERDFILKAPSSWPDPPRLALDGDRYSLDSLWARHRIIAYDETGARVKVGDLEAKSGRLRDLKLPDTTRALAVWAEDIDGLGGILSRTMPYTAK